MPRGEVHISYCRIYVSDMAHGGVLVSHHATIFVRYERYDTSAHHTPCWIRRYGDAANEQSQREYRIGYVSETLRVPPPCNYHISAQSHPSTTLDPGPTIGAGVCRPGFGSGAGRELFRGGLSTVRTCGLTHALLHICVRGGT